jgi:peptidoglycan hydrolase-like protein with peptidoglycan-binding domain
MSREILEEAYRHFEQEGQRYEYGRSDMSLKNHSPNQRSDPSRTEQDLDGDGLRGVDCSSLVWRGLKNAGYDVGSTPFGTSDLFQGSKVTDYSRKHFDVVSGEDARRQNGSLQQGDILMFKSGHGQHVAIFKGYDAKGNIEFFGSQVSTGPAVVAKGTAPGQYWNGGDFEIVGALRAKPEFQVHEPVHGRADPHAAPAPTANHQPAPARQEATTTSHGELAHGARGDAVHELQSSLGHLGYSGTHGKPLRMDGDFGANTQAAVKAFQHDHGLKVDGVAGSKTLDAIHQRTLQHGTKPATPQLHESAHPHHAVFRQAVGAVHELDARHQRVPDQRSENLAAALVVAARSAGMERIDHVVLSDDGSRAFAVQGDLSSPLRRVAEVSTAQAVTTPLDRSSAALGHTTEAKHAEQTQAAPPQEAHRRRRPVPMLLRRNDGLGHFDSK